LAGGIFEKLFDEDQVDALNNLLSVFAWLIWGFKHNEVDQLVGENENTFKGGK
jgi:hypothetical protein